jgi:hypothetical protein
MNAIHDAKACGISLGQKKDLTEQQRLIAIWMGYKAV